MVYIFGLIFTLKHQHFLSSSIIPALTVVVAVAAAAAVVVNTKTIPSYKQNVSDNIT